jgi:hypothetical protein
LAKFHQITNFLIGQTSESRSEFFEISEIRPIR